MPERSPDERICGLPLAKPPREVEDLVRVAVENLRAALLSTESGRAGRVVTQSDVQAGTASRLRTWILSSDSDLARLRYHAEFRYFEQDVYQPMRPVPPRPEDVSRVRVAAYVKALLCEGARLLEREWHQRRLCADRRPDFLHEVLRWLRLDRRAWEAVERIGSDGGRYWADRAEFGQLVTRTVTLLRTADRDFPPRMPLYDDLDLRRLADLPDDLPDLAATVERYVDEAVREVEQRLEGLLRWTAYLARDLAAGEDHILRHLDVLDENFSARYADLCMRHARNWQRAIDILDGADLDADPVRPEEEQVEP
ncbi:hypothetical protein ACFFWC_13480 [Plantactinospora siamensis]|uniref:Uncharacterized protein n=1 Tax=Plantactinospora siamensis TaxID=555372 RepID=A0ABV6P395_9ACTN